MQQTEIDEISDAFSEAWEEFFGQVMYYVPLDRERTIVDDLYEETEKKVYDFANKVQFYGTLKLTEESEVGEISGKSNTIGASITCVTKELVNKGVIYVELSSIIVTKNHNEGYRFYNIVGQYPKVQLGDNRVFTTIRVVEIINFDGEGEFIESNQ